MYNVRQVQVDYAWSQPTGGLELGQVLNSLPTLCLEEDWSSEPEFKSHVCSSCFTELLCS